MNSMQAPFSYDYMNQIISTHQPSMMHAADAGLTRFFARGLLQKAISRFEFSCPDEWDLPYLQYTLFGYGYFALLKTARYGLIPQQCGLSGIGIFYQPTQALIANPAFRVQLPPLQIGRDCALIRLQPDYCGVMDTVNYYAQLMALTAATAGTNLINSKVSYIMAAKNKNAASSIKAMLDKIFSGDPAVLVDKDLLDANGNLNYQLFEQNVKNNFIAPDCIELLRKLENRFDTEVGIPNCTQDKKERMITDEANKNEAETESRVDLWNKTLQRDLKKARELYPDLNLTIKLRDMEVDGNGSAVDSGNDDELSGDME